MITKDNFLKEKNVKKIATNLLLRDGIWFSKKKDPVSYPKEGNNLYANIEETSFWFRHRNDCIIETVKNFPPPGPIFDIGGGNGFVTLYLQKAGFSAVLIDSNEAGIFNAQKRGIHNLICSRFEDIGFKKKSLHAVGLFDVLEHIKDEYSFLLHLKDILNQDGKIYITVPTYHFLWSCEDIFAGHYRRYTLHQLITLLRKTGYEIEYATYMFSLLPIPIFLYRVLPYKLFNYKRNISLEEYKQEHNPSLAHALLHRLWNREKEIVKKKKKILFGSSCLVVAKRSPKS